MSNRILPAVAALSAALAAVSSADLEAKPFSAENLDNGYFVNFAEGSCGEGKCGGDGADDSEGNCGEGNCGEEGADDSEGNCGEGNCGDEGADDSEGNCGEGSCGEGSCGEGKCGGA